MPDEELLKLAAASRLSKPDVLAAQVSRMLADPRAKSLSDDFAFQWLHLAKLDEITPDRGQFPHASGLLDIRGAVEGGTAAVHRQRAAQRSQRDGAADRGPHLPQRAPGDALRHRDGEGRPLPSRDARADKARHGLLGKGAILMLTAYPNRTSPVLRGAWILDRLLGTPPSDPPLDVPSLPENRRGQPAQDAAGAGSSSTARSRRASPVTA